MKRFFILLLIVAFTGLVIMGIFMMKSHGDCFLDKMGSCSPDVLLMIKAHMGLFLTLSEGILGHSLLLISLFGLVVFGLIKYFSIKEQSVFYGCKKFYFEKLALHKKPFYDWLSVHENSPSFVYARI